MVDVIQSLAHAVDLARKLRAVNEKLKDAEMANLLGDLSLELADIKLRLSEVMAENATLRDRVRALEASETDPCPKCRVRAWNMIASKPAGIGGELGAKDRTYKCGSCGFSESRLELPR